MYGDYDWVNDAYQAYMDKMWDDECEAHYQEVAISLMTMDYLLSFDDDGGERCEWCNRLSKHTACCHCESVNRSEAEFEARVKANPQPGITWDFGDGN